MFEGLRTKIDAHFGASPLVKHRAEFLGVNASTPLDRKVKFTPEVVGVAAAFESWKAFERDPAHKPHGDSKLAHARAKQIVADLAASMAIRLIDEKKLPFTSTANEEKFKLDAQRFARGDAKRALRESGYYKTHELGPFEDDERAAPRKI